MFFRNRRKLRATFGILTTLLLFLVVLLSGPVMSVENSESAKNLVPTLLKNTDVRTSISNKILDQISKDNSDKKVTKSIEAVTELQNDVQLGYDFVTTNEPAITIQVKPLLSSLIGAMSSVDPQFKDAKKILKEVKPMTLTRDGNTPKIGTYLSYARDSYVALILLLAFSLFFFLRFSATGKRALRAIGTRVLVVGVLAIAQFFAIAIIASKFAKQATDPLAKTAIPVAARALFSYYQSIGIALAILGAVAVLISSRMGVSTQSPRMGTSTQKIAAVNVDS
jgi:hypothetical protein